MEMRAKHPHPPPLHCSIAHPFSLSLSLNETPPPPHINTVSMRHKRKPSAASTIAASDAAKRQKISSDTTDTDHSNSNADDDTATTQDQRDSTTKAAPSSSSSHIKCENESSTSGVTHVRLTSDDAAPNSQDMAVTDIDDNDDGVAFGSFHAIDGLTWYDMRRQPLGKPPTVDDVSSITLVRYVTGSDSALVLPLD
jgi:hypothetical protein